MDEIIMSRISFRVQLMVSMCFEYMAIKTVHYYNKFTSYIEHQTLNQEIILRMGSNRSCDKFFFLLQMKRQSAVM